MGVLHHFALRFCLRCIDVFFATHFAVFRERLGFSKANISCCVFYFRCLDEGTCVSVYVYGRVWTYVCLKVRVPDGMCVYETCVNIASPEFTVFFFILSDIDRRI